MIGERTKLANSSPYPTCGSDTSNYFRNLIAEDLSKRSSGGEADCIPLGDRGQAQGFSRLIGKIEFRNEGRKHDMRGQTND